MGRGGSNITHDALVVSVLGTVLRELREDARMVAHEVSGQMNHSPGCVSMWERGERIIGVETFAALCEVYGASPFQVLEVVEARVAIMRRYPTESVLERNIRLAIEEA